MTSKTRARISQDVAFFLVHAGYSYQPGKETKEQGAMRCARELARAERHANRKGWTVEWSIDPDSRSVVDTLADDDDFSDERPTRALWQCVVYGRTGNRVPASLGGVDFGRNGGPHGDPYARVVAAECFMEAAT
jgi:hypothetical protein